MKYVRNVVAFVRTVNEGSFSAAAASLGVSPAAVSKSVQNLEKGLGVRLLNRTTRRLALTEEGGVFFEHCRRAMLDLENAVDAVVEGGREPTGVLRVTSAVTFGRRHVLPLLAEFASLHPKVTLDVTLDDRFVDMIHEGFDVSVRIDIAPEGTLVADRLVPVQAVVCGSPDYLKRRAPIHRPKDLLKHDCIRFRSVGNRRVLQWEFQHDGKAFQLSVPGALVLNDPEGICDAVVDGRGLGQIPGFLAAPLISAGKLRPVLLDFLSQSRAVYVCHTTRRYMAPRIRAFIDFLAKKLGDNPALLLAQRPRHRAAVQ